MAPAWLLALAIATPPDDALRWSAPSSCPDAVQVRALVEQQLGRPLDADAVTIDGHIEMVGDDGYRLTLGVAQAGLRHERVLVAQECDALARASALVIALGVDAVAVAEQLQPQLVPEPRPALPSRTDVGAPSSARTSPRIRAGATPRRERQPPQLVLALVGGFERGALPGITGGIDGAVGVRGRGYRVELAGTWLGPRTADIGIGRVAVQLGTVAVRGCPELGWRTVSFPLCVGVELGAMRGRGSVAPGANTQHGLWFAPTLSPGVRIGGPRLAFVARGEVALGLVRPSFELREPGEPIAVFAPPPVSARLWLGIEFRLRGRDGSTTGRRNSGVRRG